MSLINPCIEPGCSTLCIGLFCVEHDARPSVEFPRGRPWPPLQQVVSLAVESVPGVVTAPESTLASVRSAA